MSFESYEFDENFLPNNFENNVRCCVNFNLAFYLKKKYIVDENDWLFEEDEKDGEEVVVYCPTNNECFDIDKKIVEHKACGCSHGMWSYSEPVCPHEGSCAATCYLKNAVYKHNDLTRKFNFGFLQWTNRGVVLRIFNCVFDFSGESYDLQREGELILNESVRVFFNTDRTTEIFSRLHKGYSGYSGYFSFVANSWAKKKKYQDIADFIFIGETEDTLLEGFSKYFKLTEKFTTDDAMKTVLLLAMFKYPVLKHLIKAGFLNIAEQLTVSQLDGGNVRGKLPFKAKAKAVKEFFGFEISKLSNVDEERKSELSIYDLPNLRLMDKLGIPFTNDNFIMCTSNNFGDLVNYIGEERVKETLKYLRAQTSVKVSNRVGDYYDYLTQVYKLELDLDNRQVRYPKSLKRAHDRLTALFKYTDSKDMCELFAKQSRRYEGYCYRQRNLSLRAVRTVRELRIWAERFDNCSGGYVDRIAKGDSMIFVIVDRAKPKDAYFMLEYQPMKNSIVQCRGYNNNTDMDDDPAVIDFCGKWLAFINNKKLQSTAV